MVELVLFVGIVVLFILHAKVEKRLERLEQALADGVEPDRRHETQPTESPPSMTAAELAAWVGRRSAPLPTERVAEMLAEHPPEAADAPREKNGGPDFVADVPIARETLGALFERWVGGQLLIWIGGIALALAGVFLVRYSIQLGLIGPKVRMIAAGIFGLVLLAAAELARARPGAFPDPRINQALVGAGILVLYATPYGSLVLYHLISNQTASLLMVAVTVAALVLSLRHGMPAAVLGLVGGFATPALVGDPSSSAVPLLTYLALLDFALFVIAWRRSWTWIAAGAVVLSFAWSFYLVPAPVNDALAGGLFVVALSVGASLIRPGAGWQLDFLRPVGIGLLQLALLVARTDLGAPAWYLFGALSLAAILLSGRRREFELLPVLALVIALILLAAKAVDQDRLSPAAAIGVTALFGLSALVEAWRDREPLTWTAIGAAAFAGPAIILRLAWPELLDQREWGGLMAGLALGPALLAWIAARTAAAAQSEVPMRIAAAAILVLLGIAVYDLVPEDLRPAAWMLLAAGAAFAASRLDDRGLSFLGLAAAAFASAWAVFMLPETWSTIADSIGGKAALVTGLATPARALQVLVLPACVLFVAWHWLPRHFPRPRHLLLAVAGLFLTVSAYIFAKQVFALANPADFVARGFAERLLITQILFVAGWLLGGGRIHLPWLDENEVRLIGFILTGFAAARLLWFDMLVDNPVFVDQDVGTLPVLNLLLPAYMLSAFWLYAARRRTAKELASGTWLGLFLAALIVGVWLMVRQGFHGAILTGFDVPSSEFYAYSLAGLLLSIALLLAGIRLPDKALRIAGLALLTATILKVFIRDADALEGIWRILSFLGLGIALIGIGKLYTAVLRAEAKPASA